MPVQAADVPGSGPSEIRGFIDKMNRDDRLGLDNTFALSIPLGRLVPDFLGTLLLCSTCYTHPFEQAQLIMIADKAPFTLCPLCPMSGLVLTPSWSCLTYLKHSLEATPRVYAASLAKTYRSAREEPRDS